MEIGHEGLIKKKDSNTLWDGEQNEMQICSMKHESGDLQNHVRGPNFKDFERNKQFSDHKKMEVFK
jgi:hypothetical protein